MIRKHLHRDLQDVYITITFRTDNIPCVSVEEINLATTILNGVFELNFLLAKRGKLFSLQRELQLVKDRGFAEAIIAVSVYTKAVFAAGDRTRSIKWISLCCFALLYLNTEYSIHFTLSYPKASSASLTKYNRKISRYLHFCKIELGFGVY